MPVFVEIPDEIGAVASDQSMAGKLRDGASVAFGSTACEGFSAWTAKLEMTDAMRRSAAAILLFDAIVQNPDRRVDNPNCLERGGEFRIIDHELAFAHRLIIGWKKPWEKGGMEYLEAPGRHVFVEGLRGVHIDFGPLMASWAGLSDARLREYKAAVPPEWADAREDVDAALLLIVDARDNIDGCIKELERILS